MLNLGSRQTRPFAGVAFTKSFVDLDGPGTESPSDYRRSVGGAL
jgi:hypothetical protein